MMDFLSVLYLIVFALCGILAARAIFHRDDTVRRLAYGLTLGLVMLIWLPALFAFVLGFGVAAQLLALLVAVIIAAGASFKELKRKKSGLLVLKKTNSKGELRAMLLAVVPLVLIGWILHFNHTIVTASNGSLHVGQCTYGDLCMHLGFITSISVQKTFPPQYSLLPGTPLGYPFLCDSVSSTFYTLGASLRTATMLPALYAHLVVVLGVYVLFDTWFKKKNTAVLATYMFFIGGGFGFAYIFNNKQLLALEGVDRYAEMLGGFYQTPTNLPAEGLRWVNTIADMVLPQRATLFGWALLFPALSLLYRAAIEKERKLFIPLGVIVGALPLIHTHSFVAIGIISAYLFIRSLMDLAVSMRPGSTMKLAAATAGVFLIICIISALSAMNLAEQTVGAALKIKRTSMTVLAIAATMIGVFGAVSRFRNKKSFADAIGLLLVSAILGGAAAGCIASASAVSFVFAVLGVVSSLAIGFAVKSESQPDDGVIKENKRQLIDFFIYGVIALLLAAPQLFGFTFKQSADSHSFLRWNFNWDNNSDSWLWFYIKNLGLIFILMPLGFITAKKEHRRFYAGSLVIWGICEILLFQPNPYDNNKLLFIWFALTCGIVAEYLAKTLLEPAVTVGADGTRTADKSRTAARLVLFVFALITIFLSGIMTIEREYVSADHFGPVKTENGGEKLSYVESGYELTSKELVDMSEWVKKNTAPDAVLLTCDNHNNAVAMLTGRNLFCGSATFLHWHGVNYQPRMLLIGEMYASPAENLQMNAEKYGIDYVLISNYETAKYNVDLNWFMTNLECVYNTGSVLIFKTGVSSSK